MCKKMFLALIGVLLMFSVVTATAQASTNIASFGTAGTDGLVTTWWFDQTTDNLNDGVHSASDLDGIHLDAGEPGRAYIIFDTPVFVDGVNVYHYSFQPWNYATRDFQIQTLILDGNPTNDSDWVTKVSVVGNESAVTTHNFLTTLTSGVRIYITKGSAVDTYGRIEELEVYGTESIRTNVALLGTAGNDGWGGWPNDSTSGLNDGVHSPSDVDGFHTDAGMPARAYVTFENMVVYEVDVYHYSFQPWNYATRDFQIQTLILGGDPTKDSDWVTQVSVVGNESAVTTHRFQPVPADGVRIYITKGSAVDTYGRIEELEAYGYISFESYAVGLKRTIAALSNDLAGAYADIAGLQTQLANIDITLSGTTYHLDLVGQLALAQAAADGLATQISNLSATISALNGIIAVRDATIASLNSQLAVANSTISQLQGQILTLQAEITEGLSGLTEIQRLISTPQGRRSSSWVSSGSTTGNFAEMVIDMLLAPPGQNIRTGEWK